ncbi:MAG: Hsp20/alpha crystallin family protein [Cyanobacteriota bacterium]|nr:Hsp20/alpha crystallin family protein [Cyanobacteriota bacterium]
MPITRWEPFQEIERWEPFDREPMWSLDQMQRQMNRLMERFMSSGNGGSALNYIPSAEMEETAEEIKLKLEIPGMEAKDLNVDVTENSVSISGERKSETKTEEKGIIKFCDKYSQIYTNILIRDIFSKVTDSGMIKSISTIVLL